jgi:hypothetical protein
MSSKAARRRRAREQRREREAEERMADLAPEHVACVDTDLATMAAHFEDALDVLAELAARTKVAKHQWPPVPDLRPLHVMIEEIEVTVRASRESLIAARDRVARFRDAPDHFHLVGDRVVRMVEAPYVAPECFEDLPF